jgi:HD-GYP domain-containing protein (c-di-GMP phosphodiesterase class II)
METSNPKKFNLNTIKILNEYPPTRRTINHNSEVIILCDVIGKYIGGRRWKRGSIFLSKEEIRDIRLSELLQNSP